MRRSLVEGPVLALAGYVVVVGAVLAGPRAGSLVLAGYLLAVVVLAVGVGEGLLVRGLWWCRPASVTDRRVLVGALEHLDPGVRVYVAGRQGGVDAVPVGRRSLVVTRGLVDALAARRLPLNVAVALIVGARGQRDAGICRRDPALRVAQLPAMPLLILGAAAARSRLLRAAWPFRGVFAVIAAIQTTQDGIAWVGALIWPCSGSPTPTPGGAAGGPATPSPPSTPPSRTPATDQTSPPGSTRPPAPTATGSSASATPTSPAPPP